MPSVTYEPIATTTFSSTASSYTFSSIPQTYTSLRLVARCAFAGASYTLRITPNNVGTGVKQDQYIYNTGTTKGAYIDSSSSWWLADIGMSSGQSNNPTTWILDINGYKTSGTYRGFTGKVINTPQDTATSMQHTQVQAGFDNTTAISSLVIYAGGTSFVSGDKLTLFGIGA
jgi:hypothetical protein